MLDANLQERPDTSWEKEDWEEFLKVWSAIVARKPFQGASRGEVEKSILGNWKRHFSNYAAKPKALTPLQLKKAKLLLDSKGKQLPTAMKKDIANRKVPTAKFASLPKGIDCNEEEFESPARYVQIKQGDPRYYFRLDRKYLHSNVPDPLLAPCTETICNIAVYRDRVEQGKDETPARPMGLWIVDATRKGAQFRKDKDSWKETVSWCVGRVEDAVYKSTRELHPYDSTPEDPQNFWYPVMADKKGKSVGNKTLGCNFVVVTNAVDTDVANIKAGFLKAFESMATGSMYWDVYIDDLGIYLFPNAAWEVCTFCLNDMLLVCTHATFGHYHVVYFRL